MKKLLILLTVLSMILTLFSCKKTSKSFLNGVNLEEFSIVYSDEDLDYSKRAAEFIQSQILLRTELELPIVEDSAEAVTEYEIVVGNTEREISERLDANTEGLDCALFNALVWNGETELTLRSGGAMNTIIEENVLMTENLQKKKCTSVKAVTGDGTLPFIPDLIKMDVEGCEGKAIDGCATTISEHRPILRISIYHNHRDLFEIFEKISNLNPTYRYTLRQQCRYIPAWDVELVAY